MSTDKPRSPTGVDFVDHLLKGGLQAGEVTGLMGPTGGGKSILGMQIGVSFAKTRREPVALFCYEYPFNEGYRARLYAVNSGLTYDEIAESGRRLEKLPPDKRQRVTESSRLLQPYFFPVDMVPQRGDPIGSGGVPELRQVLEREFIGQKGITPKLIIIDQLLPVILRWKPDSVCERALPQMIIDTIAALRDICLKYDTTAIVVHQSNPQEVPWARPVAGDAQECPAWASGMAEALGIGVHDFRSFCWLRALLHTEGPDREVVVRLNGPFCQFEYCAAESARMARVFSATCDRMGGRCGRPENLFGR